MSLALAGLAALAVAMGIGRFAFTPLLPMMQADAGLALADGAWLAAANYAGYLAGALSARRFGSLRAGLALIAATTLAMGFAQPLALWALWRALSGMASAWVLVQVSSHFLARGANPGVLYSGVGAGILLAGLLCLAFVHSSEAWLVLGLIAAVAAAALWRTAGSTHTANATPSWRFAALIACYGAFGFGYIIPATFIPAMARALADDPAVFGWAWPAFGAAAALSTLIANPLLRALGARRLWAWAQAVMALSVIAPIFSTGLGGILIAALGVGGTFMVITMAGMREAARVAAAPAGLMAAMTAAFAAGQIAGPLLVAAGLTMQSSLVISAALLAASSVVLFTRKENHAPAAA